jgi:transposase-like protein
MTDRPAGLANQLYKRHRFPAEIISHAVWLYFRFPLSLRHVEEMLAARRIGVSFQTVAEWAGKFGSASPTSSVHMPRQRKKSCLASSIGLTRA